MTLEDFGIDNVQILSLQPNDVIILKANRTLSDGVLDELNAKWKRIANELGLASDRVLILEEMDISILREDVG